MTGIWKNGNIVLDGPANWPEGCRVRIEPAETLGMCEENWPTDSEEIARLLAKMEEIEPFEMSAEEEADFWAWK